MKEWVEVLDIYQFSIRVNIDSYRWLDAFKKSMGCLMVQSEIERAGRSRGEVKTKGLT